MLCRPRPVTGRTLGCVIDTVDDRLLDNRIRVVMAGRTAHAAAAVFIVQVAEMTLVTVTFSNVIDVVVRYQ